MYKTIIYAAAGQFTMVGDMITERKSRSNTQATLRPATKDIARDEPHYAQDEQNSFFADVIERDYLRGSERRRWEYA